MTRGEAIAVGRRLIAPVLGGLVVGMLPPPVHAQLASDTVRVFAVLGADELHLDPVAVLTPGEWLDPIGRSVGAEAAWDAWYASRPTVHLLLGNVRTGVATAVPATSAISCLDVAGQVAWGPDGTPPVRPGVAVTDPSFGGAPLARPPDERERATLIEAVRALAGREGVPEALAARLTPVGNALTMTTPAGAPLAVLGGFLARGDGRDPPGIRPDRLVAVFAMVGAGDASDVRLERFNDAMGEGVRSWELIDVLDLTRDGTPEVIVRTLGYEGWRYDVLDEVDGGLEVLFTGGGGGC